MSTSQLSENDQATILAAARNGQPVSEALQKKLFEHVKAGHRSILQLTPHMIPIIYAAIPGKVLQIHISGRHSMTAE